MCAFINISQQKLVSGQVEVGPFLCAKRKCLYPYFFEDTFILDNTDQCLKLEPRTDP